MSNKRSLSPAQIQYLKIGPKASNCQSSKANIRQALAQQYRKGYQQSSLGTSSLNKIPKLTYGEFQKTVSNFGLLLNKNFGNQTTVHQMQKFGNLAKTINQLMLIQKDRPVYNEKKNALMKKLKDRSDNRTFLKTVYDCDGEKIHVTLKSFNIQQANGHKALDGLPIPYLRFLVQHVNSIRLAKIIEGAIKNQGNLIVVEFDKIQGRASHFSNSEVKYQNIPYVFQRLGQQLTVTLPCLEVFHVQTGYRQNIQIQNKQILETLEINFDNIDDLMSKYFEFHQFNQLLNSMKNEQTKDIKKQIQRQEEQNKKQSEQKIIQQSNDVQDSGQIFGDE